MARYDTPVRDWKVRLPKSLNMGKRKYGMRTLQQGVTLFSRKKKNGCKLISRRDLVKIKMHRDPIDNVKGEVVTCAVGFPKIKIK